MTQGIYKIINKVNQRFYLGSSKNIENRFIQHKRGLKNNAHINVLLQRAWNKYGEENFDFQIEIDCDGYSDDARYAIEQILLNGLDEKAYNISKGARGGDNISNHPDRENIIHKMSEFMYKRYAEMSDEDKKALSESMSGENNPMYGGTHSKESILKIQTGLANFYQNNSAHNKGKTYEDSFGIDEAYRIKKIISESASQRVGDKNPFYGKAHSEETKEVIRQSRIGNYYGTQNIPFTIDGVRYSSLGEASKIIGIPIVTIQWRIKSKNKKFVGYQYEL